MSENKPVARLIAKGLSRIGRPLEDIGTTIRKMLLGIGDLQIREKRQHPKLAIAGGSSHDWFLWVQ